MELKNFLGGLPYAFFYKTSKEILAGNSNFFFNHCNGTEIVSLQHLVRLVTNYITSERNNGWYVFIGEKIDVESDEAPSDFGTFYVSDYKTASEFSADGTFDSYFKSGHTHSITHNGETLEVGKNYRIEVGIYKFIKMAMEAGVPLKFTVRTLVKLFINVPSSPFNISGIAQEIMADRTEGEAKSMTTLLSAFLRGTQDITDDRLIALVRYLLPNGLKLSPNHLTAEVDMGGYLHYETCFKVISTDVENSFVYTRYCSRDMLEAHDWIYESSYVDGIYKKWEKTYSWEESLVPAKTLAYIQSIEAGKSAMMYIVTPLGKLFGICKNTEGLQVGEQVEVCITNPLSGVYPEFEIVDGSTYYPEEQ